MMSSDEQAIRELIKTWMRESMAGNLDAILPLMAEDVVFLGPGRPPMCGRGAFAAAFRSAPANLRFEMESDVREILISDNLASCWSQLSMTVSSPDGPAVKRSGPILTVFRKTAAGNWELFRDANMLTVEK